MKSFRRASIVLCIALAVVCVSGAQDADPREYVTSKQCKLCHNKPDEGEQFNVWQRARHSHAFETLLSEKAEEVAKAQGLTMPPSEAAECLRCHVTGYDVATKSHPAKLKKEDGVQCDSCHGPGSAHLADGKVLRMNKAADLDVLANLVIPSKDTCMTCHNDQNPTWDTEKYTLDSGEKTGFDFEQAAKIIAHKNPKKETN